MPSRQGLKQLQLTPYLKQPKYVTLRSGTVAGSGSVIVYMSAVKSPPQRAVTSPVQGMVQLLEAPNLVIVARSPSVGSSQLADTRDSNAQQRPEGNVSIRHALHAVWLPVTTVWGTSLHALHFRDMLAVSVAASCCQKDAVLSRISPTDVLATAAMLPWPSTTAGVSRGASQLTHHSLPHSRPKEVTFLLIAKRLYKCTTAAAAAAAAA
jgi:hypothetical protein